MPSTSHYPHPLLETRYDTGDYGALAHTINDLRATVAHDPDLVSQANARQELTPYLNNHNRYIVGVAGHIESSANRRNSGMRVGAYDLGAKTHFALSKGRAESHLDLGALGLPPLDERQQREGEQPLAVIIHEASVGGRTIPATTIQLVTLTKDGYTKSAYLENISAADSDTPDVELSHWVQPGENLFGTGVADVAEAKTKGGHGKEMLELSAVPHPYKGEHKGGRVRLVRAAPSKVEQSASVAPRHNEAHPKRKRSLRMLGAVAVAGIILGPLPIHTVDPAKNRDITAAQDMVLPSGTAQRDGVAQAEQYFDDPTLARSRAAFDAYFRGDSAALRAEVAQYGYTSNWMNPDVLKRVKDAKNFEDLHTAFDAAVSGLPISIVFATNDAALAPLTSADKLTKTTNYNDSHKLATAILDRFNTLDKSKLAHTMSPLQFVIVGKIKSYIDGMHDSAGYCAVDPNTHDTKIVLSEVAARDASTTVAHESTHYKYLSSDQSAAISSVIPALNPGSQQYSGLEHNAYEDTPTTIDGMRVVRNAYGNADEDEDIAVAGEDVNVPHPILRFDTSTLSEKTSAIIFRNEADMPGYTANLLLRTRTRQTSLLDRAWHGLEQGQLPIGVASFGVLLGVAVASQRGRAQQRTLQEYGAAGPLREPAASRLGKIVRRVVNSK